MTSYLQLFEHACNASVVPAILAVVAGHQDIGDIQLGVACKHPLCSCTRVEWAGDVGNHKVLGSSGSLLAQLTILPGK